MTFTKYKAHILSDLYRYCGKKTARSVLTSFLMIPGFRYTFWFRTTRYLKGKSILFPLYLCSRFFLLRSTYRFGIDIPYNTSIGTGLYIGHFGGIVVSHQAVIGNNFNINHGVTIGTTYGGKTPGTPKIGDNVYVGPGAFIIGGVEIGNNVAIGANTVVNKSIPENGVVVGNSGEIISHKGSGEYIVNTDY